MKVSFLVTYYNQEQYVRQSLDSILAMDLSAEWEILVGDDGSSDGTAAQVQEYVDRDPDRIRLFVMPRESGVRYDPVRRASVNRLNLVDQSTGDCFCSLDGDDFYTDTSFIREAVDVLEKDPSISVVSFGFREYRNGTFADPVLLPVSGIIETDRYIRGFYIHSGACVHRRIPDGSRTAAIRTIGSFDDNDIVMNSLLYGNMYHIPRAVYAYRQTDDSVYNTMSPLEKAVLNVKGYDINRQLIGDKYRDALLARYVSPIMMAYCARKHLREKLGETITAKYLSGCPESGESLCRDLLRYPELNGPARASVRKLVYRAARQRPVRAAKTAARTRLKG